MTENIISINL